MKRDCFLSLKLEGKRGNFASEQENFKSPAHLAVLLQQFSCSGPSEAQYRSCGITPPRHAVALQFLVLLVTEVVDG